MRVTTINTFNLLIKIHVVLMDIFKEEARAARIFFADVIEIGPLQQDSIANIKRNYKHISRVVLENFGRSLWIRKEIEFGEGRYIAWYIESSAHNE